MFSRASTAAGSAPDDPGGVAGTLGLMALALAVSFPYFEETRNANERPRLLQGMAIVDDGSFFIDGPARDRLDPGPDVARGVGGRLVPNKPPGVSLVAAGSFQVARAVHGDALTLRLYTAWTRWFSGLLPTIVLAWWLLARMRRVYGLRVARAAAWLTVFATPVASYAHLAYGHMFAALLLVVGTELIVDATANRSSREQAVQRRWRRAALGGVLAASAVVVEYAAAFASPVIALLLVARVRKVGIVPLAAACIGAALPLLGLLAYHDAVFGSPLSTGYHNVIDPAFAAKHAQGFLGLGPPRWSAVVTHIFTPDAGLLWWVPLLPFALYGLIACALQPRDPERTQGRVALAMLASFTIATVSLSFEGGWRVGPRYLVAALPFLAWGLAEAVSGARRHALAQFLLGALAAYGLIANVLAANFWPHFDTAAIVHPLPEVLLPIWREDIEPHGLARVLLGFELVRAGTIVTIVAGVWFIGRTVDGLRTAIAWLLGSLAGLALVMATERMPRHELSARNLAYILRVWEPRPEGESASRPLAPRSRS